MKKQIFLLLIMLTTALAFAQTAKNSRSINTKNGIGIQGYDAVAYFESNEAVKGSKAIASSFQNVTYYFSSEKNKSLFEKNPTRFLPQYGGFCAFGMSRGYEAPVEPEAFTIVNDKLYLNYNLKVREEWLKGKETRIERADQNWNK